MHLQVRPTVKHDADNTLIERIEVEKLLDTLRVSNRYQGQMDILQKHTFSVLETMSKDTKLSMCEWVDAEVALILQDQE